MSIQLSIITVCRNAESTIEQTLRSVAGQKIPGVEYIVIDGASTDGTLAKVNLHPGLADRIVCEPDRGLYDAMNKGAALSNGRYVCYLNADDAYLPDAIESLLSHIADWPDVDLFYGDWVGVGPGNIAVVRKARLALGWRYRLCHQAIAVRRDLLGTRPFDERYRICADLDAILRWINGGASTMYIPTPLVRFSEEGVSNTTVGRACRESLQVAMQRLGFLKSWRFCLMMMMHWIRAGTKTLINESLKKFANA